MNYSKPSKTVAPHIHFGFSLVELMIVLALSSFLLIGVVKIFISSKVIFHTQEGISNIQENQRIALDQIIRDVSSAGYMGCLQASSDRIVNTLQIDSTTDPIDGYLYEFEFPIDGIEGGSDPDTLIIRRASEGAAVPLLNKMDSQDDDTLLVDDTHPNYSSLEQWDLAVLSDCSNAAVFLITNDPQDPDNAGIIEHKSGVPVPSDLKYGGQENANTDFLRVFGGKRNSIAKIYTVGTAKYFVDDSNSGVGKSLYVDSGSRYELIEGVEDFQVLYGITSDPVNPTPSDYVEANQVANWDNVISIKISLTLATLEPVGNNIESDGRLRKTVSATIRMRNRAPS